MKTTVQPDSKKITTTSKHQSMKTEVPAMKSNYTAITTTQATNPHRANRPKLTPAQIALEKRLPLPFRRTASGGFRDVISDGRDAGGFTRRIADDCKSVIYSLEGTDGELSLSLLAECLVESQRQTNESRMPGVFEATTLDDKVLMFAVTPAPEVVVSLAGCQ